MIHTINQCVALVLIVWACWCGFSRSVNDGVIGKAVYACIALDSLAVLCNTESLRAYQIMAGAFAMLGVRHYYLRYVRKHVFKGAKA